MTELDDLKGVWQSQSGIPQERFDEIGAKVSAGTHLLQTQIFRRDAIETISSIFVVVAFGVLSLWAKNWVDWIGYVIVMVTGISIPLVLWWARHRPALQVSAANFRDFIDVEIGYLQRQVWLLRMVGWWYLLPLYAGMALVMAGLIGPDIEKGGPIVLAICLVICAALYIYLWWLNRSACKNRMEPLLKYYVEMRRGLENGDDMAEVLEGPPAEFLRPQPRPPISRLHWRLGITLTLAATVLVVVAGLLIMQRFDRRTGIFIASSGPVVSALLVVLTGIWRPREPSVKRLD